MAFDPQLPSHLKSGDVVRGAIVFAPVQTDLVDARTGLRDVPARNHPVLVIDRKASSPGKVYVLEITSKNDKYKEDQTPIFPARPVTEGAPRVWLEDDVGNEDDVEENDAEKEVDDGTEDDAEKEVDDGTEDDAEKEVDDGTEADAKPKARAGMTKPSWILHHRVYEVRWRDLRTWRSGNKARWRVGSDHMDGFMAMLRKKFGDLDLDQAQKD